MSQAGRSFWLCHECHAEMRPIQRLGVPHCASCDSEFIEILDPEVNTRPYSPLIDEPDHSNFFQSMFSSLLSAASEPGGQNGPSDSQTASANQSSSASRGGREFSMNFPGGGRGSIVFGSFGGQGQRQEGAQGLDAFFPGFAGPQANSAPAQDMLGALFQMLAREGDLPPGMGQPGALGDYAMTENGFDQIMERLMHAAGPQGPLPATDAVIEGLPRVTFDEKTLDPFAPGDEVMKVPCAHVFHPNCLQPWLKTNGSCPACRFSLVPDEANQPEPQAQPATQGQPLLTNILNRLWGQGGAQSPANEAPPPAPTQSSPSSAANPSPPTDPPVPNLSSAIPEDYRERHRRREREDYPSVDDLD